MSELKQILETAITELNSGNKAVLTAILRTTGSVPRTTGALMLSNEKGLLAGTVGGGPLENYCLKKAAVLEDARGHIESFTLDLRKAGNLGMVCGGDAEVLMTPLHDTELLNTALSLLTRRENGWLCLPLDGSEPTISQENTLSEKAAVVEQETSSFLSIPLVDASRIFILGGGHVAAEVAALLERLEIRYMVADDRPEFSDPTRFPGVEQTFTTPFTRLDEVFSDHLCPGKHDGVCIMSRGHQGDTDALRWALSTQAGYIGVMGSLRKRDGMFRKLEEEGLRDFQSRVITPIGLAIGAQTPAEIAVSIVAQLIQWRAGLDV